MIYTTQKNRISLSEALGTEGHAMRFDAAGMSRRMSSPLGLALLLTIGLLQAPTGHAQQKFSGIGRAATPAEIAAWDIDVRPDFKGLPKGKGSVKQGQQVWEAKCESCHGTFGESNEVFTPIAGGTTQRDIEVGNVANLKRADFPQRSTLMKLAHVSTLWDYINRAMPWNAPKTMPADEVYAVTAYVLHLGDIVPADFVLTQDNMKEVQAKLPNRNGLAKFTPLWDVRGKGDVTNTACMSRCASDVLVTSRLPDHARDAHGNLAAQNRLVGAVRGVDTTRPKSASAIAVSAAPPTGTANPAAVPVSRLAQKYNCTACHAPASKLVGPSYADIAARYTGNADAAATIARKIREGGSGNWGAIAMPPHPQISEADLAALVAWSLGGGK